MIKNKNELTLGSLFDGSGGFPLAGILAGVTPLCLEMSTVGRGVWHEN